MLTTTPVTQRDVAQACGWHHSTVSLALKNSPSLSASTREYIQAKARELGYQPNVSACNLSRMRNERTPGASLPLAWINQETDRNFWRTQPEAKCCFDAMRLRASEQGYHLDEFWAREPGMGASRLGQILRARGIQGVIFPVYESGDLPLNHRAWSSFSGVALNDHRLAQWLDVVSPDYYHLTDLVLRQCESQSAGRVGLVLDQEFDDLTDGLVRSSYLRAQDKLAPDERVPVCMLNATGFAAREILEQWTAQWQPQVVICRDSTTAALFESVGEAVIVPLQGRGQLGETEIAESAAALAAAAIETVSRKIQRNESGVGGVTQLHLIRGPLAAKVALPQVAKPTVTSGFASRKRAAFSPAFPWRATA